jgi:hypothetical protein
MRTLIPVGVRSVLVPTLACSLVCGGAVVAFAVAGTRALTAPSATATGEAAAGASTPLAPPAVVVVRVPAPPPVTVAPTAPEWVVRLSVAGG